MPVIINSIGAANPVEEILPTKKRATKSVLKKDGPVGFITNSEQQHEVRYRLKFNFPPPSFETILIEKLIPRGGAWVGETFDDPLALCVDRIHQLEHPTSPFRRLVEAQRPLLKRLEAYNT